MTRGRSRIRLPRGVILCLFALSTRAAVGDAAAGPATSPPERFTVQADGHPMAVWARIPAAPRGTVLLVHGRTWSARPAFDLQVPGLHRSVLESLQAQGFAAYAVDLRGYGATPRDGTGWLTPRRAAADVAAVLTWLAARHPTLSKPALVGWSFGGAVAHLTVATSPALMSSLVLFGYAPDPDIVAAPVRQPAGPLKQKNTRAAAASDFISPRVTPPEVVRSFVETALAIDPTLVDWRNEEQFVFDSSRVRVPTLLMYGARDPGIDAWFAGRFLAQLATPDKRLVVLEGADHCAHLENTHDAWVAAVVEFLSRR